MQKRYETLLLFTLQTTLDRVFLSHLSGVRAGWGKVLSLLQSMDAMLEKQIRLMGEAVFKKIMMNRLVRRLLIVLGVPDFTQVKVLNVDSQDSFLLAVLRF
ncbi:MAG TPA: hypothetical protein VIM85_00720 [Pseudomonadales bacterium]